MSAVGWLIGQNTIEISARQGIIIIDAEGEERGSTRKFCDRCPRFVLKILLRRNANDLVPNARQRFSQSLEPDCRQLWRDEYEVPKPLMVFRHDLQFGRDECLEQPHSLCQTLVAEEVRYPLLVSEIASLSQARG